MNGTVILCIIAGLIAGVIGYFIADVISILSAKSSINFDKTQEKIKSELIEKEEVYEKEKKANIENKIFEYEFAARQACEERIWEAKKRADYKEYDYKMAEQNFQTKIQELDSQYQGTIAAYAELDKQREAERTAENEARIQEEHKVCLEQLARLQEDYKAKKDELTENFQSFSESINSQKATLAEEIQAYEEKQKAIIAQFKKDEEIRQKRDFYHINISSSSKTDITKLKSLAEGFSRPEVLYKLIYEVYYKTSMEELFNRILGPSRNKGGIYKITNINDEKIYIGKAAKFIDRWRTHSKRGCGIERIKGRLYDAMFDQGLENFTWEIVETCPKEIQSEREKYWTKFYHSVEYGYNSKEGG